MALSAGTRLGSYEIIAPIGAGGMGEVYKAHDTRLNRDVAIKVLPAALALDPDRMVRFEREARLLASLDHPNIGVIYGLEETDGTQALILALIEGPTLADRIAAAPIPLEEAIPLAQQMAEAIEYAHDRGVIHRDLKPANVKITPEGTVKILDFGLAKALTGESDAPSRAPAHSPTISPTFTMRATHAGMILGTPAYMAPEQAKGKTVDRRADIWAFGVVLYEMLTGEPPFTGETATEIITSAIKEEPKLDRLPVSTPAPIRRLIERCLHKDPKRRLQAIGEARIVLSDPMEGPAPDNPPAPAPPPTPSRFGWIPWALAAALMISTLAVSFTHFREKPPVLPAGRFGIMLPGGSRQQFWELSPDGRMLCFTSNEGGANGICVRGLDSLDTRVIPGTDDATYPFWSPDGEFLGFFDQGKLKKIALSGGPAQTLCDAPTPRGGSWNRDGAIVFSPTITGGLYRVSADGGTPTEITKDGRYPEFIQGGKRFLYDGREGILAGSLDGTAPVKILPDRSRALYVPPTAGARFGHLLFERQSALMAMPFDAEKLTAKGSPVPIAENLRRGGQVGYGGFAASENGVLLMALGTETPNSTLTWLDRSGKRLESIGEPKPYNFTALSPDGKRVAFNLFGGAPDSVQHRASGRADIWLQDLERGVPTRLTFRGDFWTPTWSPDGTFIVFSTLSLTRDLYRKAGNGSGTEELLLPHAGANVTPTDISPDGKWLVYSQTGDKTRDDLWLLPLQGEHKPVVYLDSPFSENEAQFSTDGKWMAYASDESGQYQVYVQPVPATGAKRQVSNKGGSSPRWRRDGKEIFYLSAERKLMAASASLGPAGYEFGAPRQLFDSALPSAPEFRRARYQPSADGQKFLVPMPAEEAASASSPVIVQMNWQAGLKSKN